MNKRNSNVGLEISELDLAVVNGGLSNTVATEGDYNIKIDPKPIVQTAKWVWKKFKGLF